MKMLATGLLQSLQKLSHSICANSLLDTGIRKGSQMPADNRSLVRDSEHCLVQHVVSEVSQQTMRGPAWFAGSHVSLVEIMHLTGTDTFIS